MSNQRQADGVDPFGGSARGTVMSSQPPLLRTDSTAYSGVSSLTSTRSMNRMELRYVASASTVSGSTVIHVAVTIVAKHEVMLDMAVRREHQRLTYLIARQGLKVLRGQRMQPRQSVRAAHPQHSAVRAIHDATGLDQLPLLAERIAVMRGDTGIDSDTLDRTGAVKQRTGHSPWYEPRPTWFVRTAFWRRRGLRRGARQTARK